MTFTLILGIFIFTVSMLLAIFSLIGKIFRNIGAISFGILPNIFFIIFPYFCLEFEFDLIYNSPHDWGISYFFIVLNLYFLAFQYLLVVGSAVFTRNNIYRLSKYLIFKKYSYDDVIGYSMKKDSCVTRRRWGLTKVTITFDVEIHFCDETLASFSTSNENDKKISYIRKILEEHRCRKSGRIKKSKWDKLDLGH